jgi:hypothetical protein
MDMEELMGNTNSDGEKPKTDSPLLSLQKDLALYKESIKEVAVEIRVEGLSDYPIFVAHQLDITLGELILDRNDLGTSWSIHASTLEEFIERGIIISTKKEAFLKNYKNASEFACIFVVVPEGANFVYYPLA